ncbi:MAG TPA: single-stranded DNA-binding protein [Oculatellaceae cyanobacterium]
MSLATVSIVGNLVRQPEQMCFASGQKKTTLVVAVNGPKNHKTEESPADFYKVESWGKLGELTLEYLSKGNQVTVCGRLSFDHWTDKLGRQRTTPVIQASQVAFPQRSRNMQNVEPIGGTISGDLDVSDTSDSFQAATYLSDAEIAGLQDETAVSESSKTASLRPPIRRKAQTA